MLTNTAGVLRRYRSRRQSNPRLRYRHRFHDLIVRSRGASAANRPGRAEPDGGYAGERSGINPGAVHSDRLRMV